MGSKLKKALRLITSPLRALRAVVRMVRRDGLTIACKKLMGIMRTPVKQTPEKVMFVSSDNNPMSGAFLCELTLNNELNNRKHVNTRLILPYYCPIALGVVGSQKIDHRVIPSTDWVVLLKDKKTLRKRIEHYIQHTNNIYSAIAIAHMALTEGFQLIHSNTTYTYVGALAAQMAGLPHVWHLREFLEEGQSRTFYNKKQALSLLSKSKRIVTVSKTLKAKFDKLLTPERIVPIYDGIPTAFYCPEKEIFTTDTPRFLFVGGGDSPYKGRKDLIRACGILKKRKCRFLFAVCRLVWPGDGRSGCRSRHSGSYGNLR